MTQALKRADLRCTDSNEADAINEGVIFSPDELVYSQVRFGVEISTCHLVRICSLLGIGKKEIVASLVAAKYPHTEQIVSEWLRLKSASKHSFPFSISAHLAVLKGLEIVRSQSKGVRL